MRFLLQVHLIEGIIDQVEGTVHVSWVQPRVLGVPQIKSLRDRLDNWLDKVHTALLSVEAETPDLVASWFVFIDLLSAHCNDSLTKKKGIKLQRQQKEILRLSVSCLGSRASFVCFLSYCLFHHFPGRSILLYFTSESLVL